MPLRRGRDDAARSSKRFFASVVDNSPKARAETQKFEHAAWAADGLGGEAAARAAAWAARRGLTTSTAPRSAASGSESARESGVVSIFASAGELFARNERGERNERVEATRGDMKCRTVTVKTLEPG